MTIEARDLFRTLQNTPPLDQLDTPTLKRWHAATETLYFRAGESILKRGEHNRHAWLIRSGAVEVLDENDRLVNMLGEGDWFGYRSILNQGNVTLAITAQEDTLVWRFPAELFLESYRQHAAFRTFFHQHKPSRFRQALHPSTPATGPPLELGRPLRTLATPVPLLSVHDTLQQAARTLTRTEAPAVPVTTPTGHFYRLLDHRDLVSALADGYPATTPVGQIFAKQPPPILPADMPLGEALTRLLSHPPETAVVELEDGHFGVFTLSHLQQPVHPLIDVLERIGHASSLTALQDAAGQLPGLFVTLVRSHTPPRLCSEFISRAGAALAARTAHLLQQERPLPDEVPFSLVATGSLARHEQTLRTDQDNALILGDHFDPVVHGPAFADFAARFNTALVQLGYPLCPHEVMARNPQWRQPLHRWLQYFRNWIDEPLPDALLHAAIFFDMHLITGDAAMLTHLRQQILRWSRDSGLFLHHMAANALRFRPPIGFFRNFIVEDHGTHTHVFDIKKHGIAPITELARVHALAAGLPALNTWERLEQSAEAGVISQQGHEDLRDALDLIATLRLRHQARQIERDEPPDNLIDPDDLSRLERRHLRDAFTIVRDMQQALALRYNL